ncbi:MAG: hypothetical protein KGJ98_07970 [Chloroflexota bacterium]|nr:hypothetical protein [Chloroflexota bacterium]
MTIQLGLGLADPGAAAIWTRDDGSIDDPQTDAEWDEWVSARSLRHWCDVDPLLDWLDRYGTEKGFTRDDRLPTYDPRFDLSRVLAGRNEHFEELVLRDVEMRYPITRVASAPEDVRSRDAARLTWQAMAEGDPVIAHAVLRDPQARTYGVADLLVRSDVLRDLFPAAFDGETERLVASALPGQRWHYRIVDVRYTTLELLKDGALSASSDLAVIARLWTLNTALGRLQGTTPPFAYVLARGWRQGQARGTSCWDRLGRVARDTFVRSQERDVSEVVAAAAAWVRRVRHEGADWDVRPTPTVPELWPNMKDRVDRPWQRAKRDLAEGLGELTLISYVGPRLRAAAHARGVTRLDDERATAAFLGLNGQNGERIVDAILTGDRARDHGYVRPARITADEERWRAPAPVECYVDFETVNDVLDDLSTFPERGGQSLIFQIGCGRCVDGRWDFRSFVADALTVEAEADTIDEWIAHLRALAAEAGAQWPDGVRIFHWSAAETSAIENAYRSAALRHRERHWPDLGWYDLLEKVIHPEPVVVRGAHAFGLKAVASAMFRWGLISTQWSEGLADGAGVMAGAWHASQEATLRGLRLPDVAILCEIERYNEIDCRVMAEVLDHLRREH